MRSICCLDWPGCCCGRGCGRGCCSTWCFAARCCAPLKLPRRATRSSASRCSLCWEESPWDGCSRDRPGCHALRESSIHKLRLAIRLERKSVAGQGLNQLDIGVSHGARLSLALVEELLETDAALGVDPDGDLAKYLEHVGILRDQVELGHLDAIHDFRLPVRDGPLFFKIVAAGAEAQREITLILAQPL